MAALHLITNVLLVGTIPALWAFDALKKFDPANAGERGEVENVNPVQEEVR